MRKPLLLAISACLILMANLIVSCGYQKILYDKILFGRGGGFTGRYDEYLLSKNGNVYHKNPATKAFTKIQSLSRKQTKAIFKDIDDNKLFELGFNYPYNMSSYIEIVKDTVSNRIVWGNAKNPPPAAVTDLFDKLMGFGVISTNNNQLKTNKK
jgi:hypothetical protein